MNDRWGADMSAGVRGRTADRGRRLLATLATSVLVCVGMLLAPTAAMADDIDPEEYPPPPVEEEVAGPPADELVRTGAGSSWPWLTAAGVGLLAVGGSLVIMRRRLTHD